jgi:cytochrome c-type biogenesis protein CcmH/NrfF
MKQIDVFVDSVYEDIDGNNEEIQELKVEMKSHLLEAVHELIEEGKTEEEAIEIAIERFGGEHEMRPDLVQLFQPQKLFSKWVLYLAIGCLLVGFAVFGFVQSIEGENRDINMHVAGEIADMLHNKDVVSEEDQNKIIELVNSTNHIPIIRVYSQKDFEEQANNYKDIFDYAKRATPNYKYEREVADPTWMLVDFGNSGSGNSEWYVHVVARQVDAWLIVGLFGGIALYMTLFAIWATINAYHHKRLNVGWVLAFTFFNVVGYLAYYFIGKKKSATVTTGA